MTESESGVLPLHYTSLSERIELYINEAVLSRTFFDYFTKKSKKYYSVFSALISSLFLLKITAQAAKLIKATA